MRLFTLILLLIATPALALNEDLQCVPYVRAVTGVQIYGDAHSWWDKAGGAYTRSTRPKVGAVMAFKPFASSALGHVAAVSRIIDTRTVLISHANWSRINGTRGHIEENVQAVDVSEAGDWSRVRVWHDGSQALGTTQWPLYGFIYPNRVLSKNEARMAVADLTGRNYAPATPKTALRTPEFTPIKKAAPTFRLSAKTLSEVESKAVAEQKSAWQRPASASHQKSADAPRRDEDILGKMIASLGN
jgi:surface antigen